ncbi:hypothetical protein GGI05_004099, partial [Coemansia sp. RSA 2603]
FGTPQYRQQSNALFNALRDLTIDADGTVKKPIVVVGDSESSSPGSDQRIGSPKSDSFESQYRKKMRTRSKRRSEKRKSSHVF